VALFHDDLPVCEGVLIGVGEDQGAISLCQVVLGLILFYLPFTFQEVLQVVKGRGSKIRREDRWRHDSSSHLLSKQPNVIKSVVATCSIYCQMERVQALECNELRLIAPEEIKEMALVYPCMRTHDNSRSTGPHQAICKHV
jgi:hypothetical protein